MKTDLTKKQKKAIQKLRVDQEKRIKEERKAYIPMRDIVRG